jgi:hypothetical protein
MKLKEEVEKTARNNITFSRSERDSWSSQVNGGIILARHSNAHDLGIFCCDAKGAATIDFS